MNKYMLSAVVFAVMIAGCVGQAPTDTTGCSTASVDGLSITCFSTALAELRSDQSTTFQIEVENQGEAVAAQANGAAHLIIPTDWELDKSATQDFPRDLKNADPATGRPADVYQFRWRGTAPELSRGQVRTDTVIGRVYYDYMTTSNGVIPVYPFGETIDQTASFTSSRGPVAISVAVSPNPPQIELDSEEFSLTIVLTNTGPGQVYQNGTVTYTDISLKDTERDVVNLEVDGVNITDKGCLEDIELISGTATVICDVTIR